MDPDTGGASPSGYYRSIVGDLTYMTHNVIGEELPPGVRGDPGVSVVPDRTGSGAGDAFSPRSSGAATTAAPQRLVKLLSATTSIRRIAIPSR